MEVSIMTFNLRFHTETDEGNCWTYRKDGVADIFARYRPTVAGTQEGLSGMLDDLQQRLPEYAWVGEGRKGGSECEHNAIFYRKDEVQLVDWGQFWLSEQPAGPLEKSWGATHYRISTWAQFRFKADPERQFLHYNTHLDHSSQLAREKGSRLLWERLEAHRSRVRLPVLLTGDMNAEPDNPAIAFLRGQLEADGARSTLTDAYLTLPGEPGLSFHCFRGGEEGRPIDYVFASPDVAWTGVRIIRDRVNGLYPSDHYPVLAQAVL
ncbi:endonuclease/exonuclease/phosphatase family protein [Paenibacillus hodogayensis]|uniref:Endonuclease/exonuclease/phosphatase family protein n=1 Tax=Paenibacillus hodogayensis TaxID=279208 RepID=A0ABV5VYQ0_9BACL